MEHPLIFVLTGTVVFTGLILLLVVSFSWAVAVDLVPVADRPYVDSTNDNTVMELIFGHNGIERLANCVKSVEGADEVLVDKLIALGIISVLDLDDVGVEPLVGGMPPPNTSWGGSPRLAAGSGAWNVPTRRGCGCSITRKPRRCSTRW